MKSTFRGLSLAAALLAAASPAAAQRCTSTGDTVYVAQKIITMNPAQPTATAVAVRGGRIQAVGTLQAVVDSLGGSCVIVQDFAGRVILPGFVEAHTHLQMYGLFSQVPYIGYYNRPMPLGTAIGLRSWNDVVAALRQLLAARKAGDTHPLFAFGVDPIFWGGRLTATDVDAISSTIPILLQLGSGHIVVANSPMLRMLQAHSPATWKSLVDRGYAVTQNGSPTGELDELDAVEYAMEVLKSEHPGLFVPDSLVTAIREGAGMMQRAGITTGTDLMFGVPGAAAQLTARRLYQAEASRGLPVRVALGYNAFQLRANLGTRLMVQGLRDARAMDNDFVWTGPLKIIFDGSIQGYTAKMDPPGYTAPVGPTNPIWNISPTDSLRALMSPFWQAGFPIAVHVNGDSAAEQLLGVVRQIAPNGAGWKITLEHGQTAHLDDFVAMRSAQTTVNLFTPHIYYYGDQHVRYTIGAARAAIMDNAHWADSLGIPFSLHSDAPVTPAQPLFEAWTAVARTTCTGQVLGSGNALSVDRALWAITMGGATLLGRQDSIGSIQKGKWADFAVLDRDPSVADGSALLAAQVVATVLNGRVIPVASSLASTHQPACTAGP
jgi:predicted amidohydrolase YtcJ